jgi:hypothetical protein
VSAPCLSAAARARRKPLFAGIASVFALAAPTSTLAATVTSCLDDGAGSLRQLIAVASNGSTIDFAGLTCVPSTISLASQINFNLPSLTIDASGATTPLTIDASTIPHGSVPHYGDFRVFYHTGAGTLTIRNLYLTGGYEHHASFIYPTAGGCVHSNGSVTLENSTVAHCSVVNDGYTYAAVGGGVSTNGTLTLVNSTLYYNSAGSDHTSAKGGGAYVNSGDLILQNSLISRNFAGTTTSDGSGGGAFVSGALTSDGSEFGKNDVVSFAGNAKGGAAFVTGDSSLTNGSVASYNFANAPSGAAEGGGFYSAGKLTLSVAIVTHNSANGSPSRGGGARVLGDFSASYSTVDYNAAKGSSSYGGGLFLKGLNNTIARSTISNNKSSYYAGIDVFRSASAGATLLISNSTISGNVATGNSGGLYSNSGATKVYNSTIAFNTAGTANPGLSLATFTDSVAATLKSNLIVYNTVGASSNDFSVTLGLHPVTINGGNLAAAAKNLIGATAFPTASLPDDTLIGVCPRLGPLRDNGGLTYTHALLSGSPAIDNGNDTFAALFDQRGQASVTGDIDYTRFSGLTAIADIGAYEVQQNDIVFKVNFEGCPLL